MTTLTWLRDSFTCHRLTYGGHALGQTGDSGAAVEPRCACGVWGKHLWGCGRGRPGMACRSSGLGRAQRLAQA